MLPEVSARFGASAPGDTPTSEKITSSTYITSLDDGVFRWLMDGRAR
jgi:hypothetical protein